MKKRQWTSEQKLQIVMQGVKGRPVSEIRNEFQIGQSQYYLWRDQFLQNAGKVFEMPQKAQQQTRLERENEKLKAMVGELTMELKKAIGETSAVSCGGSRVVRFFIAQTDSDYQRRPSILGLSPSLGLFEIRRRVVGQQKTGLSTAVREYLLVKADTRLLDKRVSNTLKPRPERANQCANRLI